jgi:excisionase family DNA binding protein
MKTTGLSIKELAAILGVSTDTIRRAARVGNLPFTRVGTAYRFNLRQVLAQTERNARDPSRKRSAGAPGGDSRPRAHTISPRAGNTGALPPAPVTGGPRIR